MWVVCTECSKGEEIGDTVGVARLNKGEVQVEEIKHFDHTQMIHRGVCDDCRKKTEAAFVVEMLPDARGSVYQEGADIQKRLRALEKQHPDWSREQCSTQAVADHNSPLLESNEAYRAYLLDR